MDDDGMRAPTDSPQFYLVSMHLRHGTVEWAALGKVNDSTD
jgi:hypothetical protein